MSSTDTAGEYSDDLMSLKNLLDQDSLDPHDQKAAASDEYEENLSDVVTRAKLDHHTEATPNGFEDDTEKASLGTFIISVLVFRIFHISLMKLTGTIIIRRRRPRRRGIL